MKASKEFIRLKAEESFLCHRFQSASFDAPYHYHPEIELTLILRSSGTRFIGDHIGAFESGDLVLLGSGLPHFWCNHHQADPEYLRSESIVIQFAEDSFGEGFFDIPELRPIQRLLIEANRGIQFTGCVAEEITEAMLKINEAKGYQRIIQLIQILHRLAAVPESQIPLATVGYQRNTRPMGSERIEKVVSYVAQHFSTPLKLREASRLASLSEEAFCRTFKRYTGRTFTGFVNDVRISHACQQLSQEQELTIAEIAIDSGFQSLANFNRRFRERMQMTPSQYRLKFRSS